MRKVQERGNELATVLISTYLRDLHWCTTHLGTKVQLFYERAKGRCIFHYCRVIFEIGLSSICDIMSFPIPSFAPFLCSSAKVVHQPLKVERSGRQAVSDWIFLLRRVFSPKTFPLSMSVLRNADGNGNERLTKMLIKINRQHTNGFLHW